VFGAGAPAPAIGGGGVISFLRALVEAVRLAYYEWVIRTYPRRWG
jgi:hypothetical protein